MHHRTLERQLRRIYGSLEHVPSELTPLLEVVTRTYEGFDTDRQLIERSLELSSKELSETNQQLRAEKKDMEEEIVRRTNEVTEELQRTKRLNKAMIARELKMKELKQEIGRLKRAQQIGF